MRLTGFTHTLLAGALFVVSVGIYAAWYAYVDRVSAQATAIRNEIAAIKEGTEAAAQTERILGQLAGTEAAIAGYFVSTQDVVPFLESLGAEGARLGASVEVVSVSELRDARKGGITVSLKISGTFDSVMRTLGSIEYSPYNIVFQKVTLDSITTDAGTSWVASVGMQVGTSAPEITP